jgi:hypothetical protein
VGGRKKKAFPNGFEGEIEIEGGEVLEERQNKGGLALRKELEEVGLREGLEIGLEERGEKIIHLSEADASF